MTKQHSILFDRWFLSASLLGTMVMGGLAAYGTLTIQIAMVGTVVSIMSGVCLAVMQQIERFSLESRAAMEQLGLVLPLTVDSTLRESCLEFVRALQAIHNTSSPAFKTLGREHVASLSDDFRDLARQRLVFVGTEGWRTAYAEILQDDDLTEYRSVAWVRSDSYWQDQPGLQSLGINCELAARGVRVTRIVVHRSPLPGEICSPTLESMATWPLVFWKRMRRHRRHCSSDCRSI